MKLHPPYPTLLSLVVLFFVHQSCSQSSSPSSSGSPSSASPSSASPTSPAATTPFTTIFTSTIVQVANGESSTIEVPITQVITPSAPSPTNNGNSSNSNSNSNGNHTTTPTILPTAKPSVDGGGNPGGLAPSPGGGNGQFGPGDNFIAGALALQVNIALITLVGFVVGAATIL